MAVKELLELIKKLTPKDNFKPNTVQVIRTAVRPTIESPNISTLSGAEKVHFLACSRADCILIESGGRFAMLDCGSADYSEKTVEYIKSVAGGRINLEFVALTHLHPGHIGALDALFDDKDVKIGKIYLKPFISSSIAEWDKCRKDGEQTYNSICQKAQSRNIPVIGAIPEDQFTLGGWKLKFFNTEPDGYHKNIGENDNSLALLLEANGKRLLLTGDMVNDTGDLVRLAATVGRVDVLKAPCHGERPLPEGVMKKLRPDTVIITNRLANVSDAVLVDIMSAFGRRTYSTADSGGVLLTVSNEGIFVSRGIQK